MKKIIAASVVSASLLGGVLVPAAQAAQTTTPVVPTTVDAQKVTPQKYTTTKGAEQALEVALKNIGKPFKDGGTSPKGFDASGLVNYAFKQGAKLDIPRSVATQFKAGVAVKDQKWKKGDVVFFDLTGKKAPSFVGLYDGKGQVVAATTKGVKLFSITTGYWKDKVFAVKRFVK
ncbi:NLP/P60 protein [Fictibacillus macauensis ZFHKF-1]|uniref:NLP/P60 protein n=1 Tax=Fictibacillus macauensis ZFHKF-1 TaxID=1196324 RepID=I8ADZ1_9BACL|nr:C40 family peptidase [Fictibacillus macauensis]EIT83812.1 NLP/P60 protein [Fictibacillus macauensis ZFHKF-1]